MKVYVDGELPKSCVDCMCWGDYLGCNIGDFNEGTCPLQALTDYTKQVRKETCEEIKRMSAIDIVNKQYIIETEILDQIQGETK